MANMEEEESHTDDLIRQAPGWGASAQIRRKEVHIDRYHRIERLPDEVSSCIRSGATITNSEDVVIGLLQNCLDAKAMEVQIEVNLLRGNVTVEDNGSGIPRADFDKYGLLGKAYCTSKKKPGLQENSYGRNGLFLAALGALSLMSIISRFEGHRSTNAIIVQHSSIKKRLVPAPATLQLSSQCAGTKVTVRNLFGNVPVRSTYRSALMGTPLGRQHAWDHLKIRVLSLLLAWRRPINVRMLESDGTDTVTLTMNHHEVAFASRNGEQVRWSRNMVNSLLSRAGLTEQGSLDSWVHVSAQTSRISVKGFISVEPHPTRRVQFMSIGIMPLMADDNNELFKTVNDVFNSSDFGVVYLEGSQGPDDTPLSSNRAFDVGVSKSRQRRVGKGIDRWPVFVLGFEQHHINASRTEISIPVVDFELKEYCDLVRVVAIGWLQKHGFRIRASKDFTRSKGSRLIGSPAESHVSHTGSPSVLAPSKASRRTGASSLRSQLQLPTGLDLLHDDRLPRSDTSRIRMSKGYAARPPVVRPANEQAALAVEDKDVDVKLAELSSTYSDPSLDEALLAQEEALMTPTHLDESPSDGIVVWQDPVTKVDYQVNSRTGQAVLPLQPMSANRRLHHDSSRTLLAAKAPMTLSRLTGRGNSTVAASSRVKQVLSEWHNPVFKRPDTRIPCAVTDLAIAEQGCQYNPHKPQSNADGMFASCKAHRLNKTQLRLAKVITQVDSKFILISVDSGSERDNPAIEPGPRKLVLVDQHAADERCKLESLLEAMFDITPDAQHTAAVPNPDRCIVRTEDLVSPLVFEISAQDSDRLQRSSQYLGRWGFHYDVTASRAVTASGLKKPGNGILTVHTLPAAILTRCTAEPRLLVDMLRSEAYEDRTVRNSEISRHQGSQSLDDPARADADLAEPNATWLRMISDMPDGMLDLLNSRACRSAIMFNDVLTQAECERLIQDLANTVFPFQCAHGRPSMVPLTIDGPSSEISRRGRLVFASGNGDVEDGSFLARYRDWQTI